MRKQSSYKTLLTILNIFYGLAAFGRLITTPNNAYSVVGWNNYSMNCSSTLGSESITWFFVPVGDNVNDTIASGATVYPNFTHLYWVDQPTTDASNLIIRSVGLYDAGTFTCADSEMVAHAQMLLYYDIILTTNASDDSLREYTCQLLYVGNQFFPPIFHLSRYLYHKVYKINYTHSPQLGTWNSLNSVSLTFSETSSCLSAVACTVMFGPPVGNMLPDSATNAPYNGWGEFYPTETALCVLSVTEAASGYALYFGAMLTCDLNSESPVNYSWIDLSNGHLSIGPKLTIWHSGSYQCAAAFDSIFSWQSYSLSTTIYNLTIEKASLNAKPSYGPIAGGTHFTLTFENWSKQISNISVVYLGGILKSTDLQIDSVGGNVVMTTPNATAELIGQPLPITIEFTPGPYNITTNLSFTYQDNPEITDISPSTFIATGGTIVNVTGTQLSSVANPLIQVILVVEREIERNITTEKSIESCEVEDSSHMTCQMPSVNIPDDFLQALNSHYNSLSKRDANSVNHLRTANQFLLSRGKRFANALSLTGPNGVDQLIISLGFILDGYQKYYNINDVLPDTQILIFSPPEINFTKDILEFDPDRDESISIKGNHMTRGCRIVDYVVQVGADICENIDLTDNQLRCRPPKQRPQSNQNISIYCDEYLGIYIHLGYKIYQYACMRYSTRPLGLIIGLAVGLSSFVIIILLIIAIVCCCKRSRNHPNKSTNKTLAKNTGATNEAHEPPSDQVHADAVYIRPAVQAMDADDVYANEVYLRPTVQSLYGNDVFERPSIELYANASELRRIDKHA